MTNTRPPRDAVVKVEIVDPAESPGADYAAFLAREKVRAVQGNTDARLLLAAEFYRDDSGERCHYGRAELCFLRWAIARGVHNSPAAARPGSPWWRAVNNRLLCDKVEADLLSSGMTGRPSSRGVELWVEFITAPTPQRWYRAHNASITAGYLQHEPLARAELPAERFMMNAALARVLFAHAMVARPRIALGRLAPLGPRLADPRRHTVRLFLDLRRAYPERYPLRGITVDKLIAREGQLPRILDYGFIAPRATAIYEFAATSIEETGIAEMIDDGAPCYAWPAARREVWSASRTRLSPRLAAFAAGPDVRRG